MFKNFHLFIFLLMFLTSCITDIVSDLEKSENIIVVNSYFTPDSTFRVGITRLDDLLGKNYYQVDETEWINTDKIIGNLKVELTSSDDKSEILTKTGSTIFESKTLKAQENQTYTIKVTANDFPITTATETIPEKIKIIKTSYDGFVEYNSKYHQEDHQIRVKFKDDANETNYYSIIVYFYTPYGYVNPKIQDPIIEGRNFNYHYYQEIIFSDKLINGKEYDIKFLVRYFKDELYYVVELRNISESYFFNKKKMDGNISNTQSTMFFDPRTGLAVQGEPKFMHTNITNGLGIFAGYSFDRDTVYTGK